MKKNLLVELFVEELPPKALKKLGDAFADGVANGLRAQRLASPDSVATPYASPRRLATRAPRDPCASGARRYAASCRRETAGATEGSRSAARDRAADRRPVAAAARYASSHRSRTAGHVHAWHVA